MDAGRGGLARFPAAQIEHNVPNGSPPLRRYFGAVLPRCEAEEINSATSCMLRRNNASKMTTSESKFQEIDDDAETKTKNLRPKPNEFWTFGQSKYFVLGAAERTSISRDRVFKRWQLRTRKLFLLR